MINVLFVCLGNICRSPMAEFIFKDMIKRKGLIDNFFIDSAATSSENTYTKTGMYYDAKEMLKEKGIPFTEHIARQIHKQDYTKFDYILAMEDKNVRDIIRIVGNDYDNKVYRLLDFTENPRNIADPWYSENFDSAYYDIEYGCQKFLESVLKVKDK